MVVTVNITENITDSTVNAVKELLKGVDKVEDTVQVNIHSAGGMLQSGLEIAQLLNEYEQVITFTDYCMSAATPIFLTGKVRMVSDDVQFLIHQPSMVLEGNKEDFVIGAAVLTIAENELIDLYSQFTEPVNFIPYMMNEELIDCITLINFNFATIIL